MHTHPMNNWIYIYIYIYICTIDKRELVKIEIYFLSIGWQL